MTPATAAAVADHQDAAAADPRDTAATPPTTAAVIDHQDAVTPPPSRITRTPRRHRPPPPSRIGRTLPPPSRIGRTLPPPLPRIPIRLRRHGSPPTTHTPDQPRAASRPCRGGHPRHRRQGRPLRLQHRPLSVGTRSQGSSLSS